jgi:hypothetical protein
MVVNEALLKAYFDGSILNQEVARWSVHLVFMSAILVVSWLRRKRPSTENTSANLDITDPQAH